MKHSERCKECKETVKLMLEKLYGKIEVSYTFKNVRTQPEDYKNKPFYEHLRCIYDRLVNYRGHKNFVRAKTLPPCDFFVPKPGFIVEFEESQHFTEPRKLSLELYPPTLKLGFDRTKWIKLCKEIQAKDNDPPFRDEQRAWYDTLRDFLPWIKGLKPTVRLYAKQRRWCDMNPENPKDLEEFRKEIEGETREGEVSFETKIYRCPERLIIVVSAGKSVEEAIGKLPGGSFKGCRPVDDNELCDTWKNFNPEVVRVVLTDKGYGSLGSAQGVLNAVESIWSSLNSKCGEEKKADFLITPGGFIEFPFPAGIPNPGRPPQNINPSAVSALEGYAQSYIGSTLSISCLSSVAKYVSIGIDGHGWVGGKCYTGEFVFLFDASTSNAIVHTAKSYPTTNEEKYLIRITNLNTHFHNNLVVLGCHDANMLNPRAHAKAEAWRKSLINNFLNMLRSMNPNLILLQHPHFTVKVKTWLNSYSYITKNFPNARYASAGRYYEPGKTPDPLIKVLSKTTNMKSVDFVFL